MMSTFRERLNYDIDKYNSILILAMTRISISAISEIPRNYQSSDVTPYNPRI